jgi:hypothetical protein
MAKNDRLDDYVMFYQEIPASDYLRGFDMEIEDHMEDSSSPQGLDASQVSQLTQDTYDHGTGVKPANDGGDAKEQTLFDDQA